MYRFFYTYVCLHFFLKKIDLRRSLVISNICFQSNVARQESLKKKVKLIFYCTRIKLQYTHRVGYCILFKAAEVVLETVSESF